MRLLCATSNGRARYAVARATEIDAVPRAVRGAAGPAALPELAKFLAQLLPCRRPIVSNAVAQLCHVALDLKLILLEPRDIELLSRGATLELSGDIFIIVTDDPVRLGAISRTRTLEKAEEHTS